MAKHIDYYVSLNSPWTYLGSKRFEAIVKSSFPPTRCRRRNA